MQFTKKRKMVAAILAIAFIAYQGVLFSLCGFGGHTAVFWVSWAFMLAAYGAMTVSVTILGQRGMFMRDWLFGFPIAKHSTVFLTAEFLVSCAFIVFEERVSFRWAFAIQFLMLCLYGVCAVSCFLAKATIDEVQGGVREKTAFIKLLRLDAEKLAESCPDPDTRSECAKLVEAARFSDPVSLECLGELGQQIAAVSPECAQAMAAGDAAMARELCRKAVRLLGERNRMCKAMK